MNSRLIYACKNAEINLKSTTGNGFNFRIMNSLVDSLGVRLTWFDCKYSFYLGSDKFISQKQINFTFMEVLVNTRVKLSSDCMRL